MLAFQISLRSCQLLWQSGELPVETGEPRGPLVSSLLTSCKLPVGGLPVLLCKSCSFRLLLAHSSHRHGKEVGKSGGRMSRGQASAVVGQPAGPQSCGRGCAQRHVRQGSLPLPQGSSGESRDRHQARWFLVLLHLVFTGTRCGGSAGSPVWRGRQAEAGEQLAP